MSGPSSADWREVNELFDAIADLPAEQRAAALETRCASDEVKREVRALIAAMDASPIEFDAALVVDSLRENEPATLAGQRLGPWQVVREVGRGGMGAVFEAFRADDHYQKRVAVKTLGRVVDRTVIARRFQQERQILASLEHANIASLIDGGQTADGMPYLVMEFVDGEPIDRYCDTAGLHIRERLDLFRQVCSAVQYAHRNLVVHRDIKPSNILVTKDGTVKLVDFGIAKMLDDGGGSTNAAITETGYRAFTTGFASPEQVSGLQISTATDVYSLGVVLYLLLAGRLPFDVASLSPTEAIRRICDEAPSAPSHSCTDEAATRLGFARRDQLARALAGELDDIVLTTLRKEPDRRYATVAALSDDIKRLLQGYQVLARPDTWRYRVRSFSRRNPRLVGALGIAAASLAGGAVIAASQARRAIRERDRARVESQRSANVVSFIEQMLATPTQAALSGATVDLLDQTVARAAAELASDPLARAAVYRTAANAYVIHYRADRAKALLDSAMTIDREHAGPESTEMGRDLTILARLVYIGGKYDSAVVDSREAVRLLQAYPSNRPTDLSTALLYLGFALTYAGHPAEGKPFVEEAIARERARPHSNLLPYLYVALADVDVFSGKNAGATESYRRSVALFDSLPVPDPAERGIAELGLARLLAYGSTIPEAVTHANRALAVFEKRWGTIHPYTAQAHALVARLASLQGDHVAALRSIQIAVDIQAQAGAGTMERVGLEFDRARVLYDLKRFREMESLLRATRVTLVHDAPDSWQMHATLDEYLGQAIFRQKRYREAEAVFRRAFDSFLARNGRENLRTQGAARTLLTLCVVAGDEAGAARYATFIVPTDSVRPLRQRALVLRQEMER